MNKKRQLTKGNYELPPVEPPKTEEERPEFEREVLKRLGGSTAMVRGDKLIDLGEEEK